MTFSIDRELDKRYDILSLLNNVLSHPDNILCDYLFLIIQLQNLIKEYFQFKLYYLNIIALYFFFLNTNMILRFLKKDFRIYRKNVHKSKGLIF